MQLTACGSERETPAQGARLSSCSPWRGSKWVMTELPLLLTDDAARDLDEIYARIHLQRSWSEAEAVLERIASAFSAAASAPGAGRHPQELLELGIADYRETVTGEIRLIYREEAGSICILLIVDGRRDLRSLLQRRLLEA